MTLGNKTPSQTSAKITPSKCDLDAISHLRNRKMTLTVWLGDSGLITKDCECLRAVLYVKMAGVPATIIHRRNPMLSMYEYPIFICSGLRLTNTADIIAFLRMQNYSLDYHLSPSDCSEAYAMDNYVANTLKPVLEYVYWLDSKNYEEFTHLWHVRAMPIPFNLFYPWTRRKSAHEFVTANLPEDITMEAMKTQLYSDATEVFAMLSKRLGSSNYFYGDEPTTLDATVFAYLAPLLFVSLPANELRAGLTSWPNLVRFVHRINKQYFPGVASECKYVRVSNWSTDSTENNSLSSTVYAMIFATLFLCGFAISKNLINVQGIKSVVGMT